MTARIHPAAEHPAKQRIVAGARQRFLSQGFRGVTMEELAGELGMSKKTLYAHFPSKVALVEAVISEKQREIDADLRRIAAVRSAGFAARLQQLLDALRRQLDEIQPPFVRDVRRETPDLFRRVEAFRRERIQRYFGKIFEEGRACGLVRKDVPPDLMVELLLGSMQAVMNPQKIEELGLTPKTAFLAVVKLVLEGALVNPRQKGKSK